jgi:hypothetical protein
MGFGWCYDMTWTETGVTLGVRDELHNVRWYGLTEGGPEGAITWGLDAADKSLTGNSVNMDTYLQAVDQYIQHCSGNGYPTKMIFTTGPVDNGGGNMAGTENGYQREIKHDYIRNYVSASSTRILFDYADILCWNNSGVKYITNWNDGGTLRPHANIHPDNTMDYDASWNVTTPVEDGDHIGEVGALRLAKAMWWMLARIAGWDGGLSAIPQIVSPDLPSLSVKIAKPEITIYLNNIEDFATVSLYDIQGKIIDLKENVYEYCLFNSETLTPGVYVIAVSTSRSRITKKIII